MASPDPRKETRVRPTNPSHTIVIVGTTTMTLHGNIAPPGSHPNNPMVVAGRPTSQIIGLQTSPTNGQLGATAPGVSAVAPGDDKYPEESSLPHCIGMLLTLFPHIA